MEYCYHNNLKEFDTAPSYGNGFIEFCIGKILGNKSDVLINTKIGNTPFNDKNFNVSKMKVSLEHSLKRLAVESVNILFLHNPRNDVESFDEVIDFMSDLKLKGLIKFKGISLAKNFRYDPEVLKKFDVIQDDGNLLDMRFLDLDIPKNSKFMARSPLASGILSGKIKKNSTFSKDDHRSEWLKQVRLESIMKRVDEINMISDIRLIDLAKNFILSNKKVNNVIFGVKKSDHIDSIIESCSQIRLSKDIEKKLIDLYKNDYGLVGESDLTL